MRHKYSLWQKSKHCQAEVYKHYSNFRVALKKLKERRKLDYIEEAWITHYVGNK